jgi:hypothetical protein
MEDSFVGAGIGMIIVFFLFYFIYKDISYDLNVVDTKVELVDGAIYNCIEATSHDNHMTYLKLKDCRLTIPSKKIKMIKTMRVH